MNQNYDGRSDQGSLRSDQTVRRPETIFANCLPVIVFACNWETHQRCGLERCGDSPKKAVIHNIYKQLYLIFSSSYLFQVSVVETRRPA